jgi:hypothetical protein
MENQSYKKSSNEKRDNMLLKRKRKRDKECKLILNMKK